jgi:hypothetical protein
MITNSKSCRNEVLDTSKTLRLDLGITPNKAHDATHCDPPDPR